MNLLTSTVVGDKRFEISSWHFSIWQIFHLDTNLISERIASRMLNCQRNVTNGRLSCSPMVSAVPALSTPPTARRWPLTATLLQLSSISRQIRIKWARRLCCNFCRDHSACWTYQLSEKNGELVEQPIKIKLIEKNEKNEFKIRNQQVSLVQSLVLSAVEWRMGPSVDVKNDMLFCEVSKKKLLVDQNAKASNVHISVPTLPIPLKFSLLS